MKIYSRADWGARYGNGFGNRAVGRLNKFLHHSVTSNLPENATFAQDAAQVRILENIGQQRFGGGISYTFAIAPSGRIFEGHSIGRIGAHTKGYNTVGVGIVLIGTYSSRTPTKAQQDALVWLLQEGVRRGWWKDPALTGGHRNVVSTSCPGDAAYAIIARINERGRGQAVSSGSASTSKSTHRNGVDSMPIIYRATGSAPHGILAHNGGFAALRNDEERQNLLKAGAKEIWLTKLVLDELIADARGKYAA